MLEKDESYLLTLSMPYFWKATYIGEGLQTGIGYQFMTGGTTISIVINGGDNIGNSMMF